MAEMIPVLISTGVSAMAAEQRAKATTKSVRQASETRNAQMNAKLAADERLRKQNLKRQKATQMARFGAMGLNPNEGSSAALLTGMQTNADAQASDRARLNATSQTGGSSGSGANLLAKNSRLIQSTLDKLILRQ